MKDQNSIRLHASYYYTLGYNVSCIGFLSTNEIISVDLKNPYHEWQKLAIKRQSVSDFLSYDWENALGVGAILGYNDYRVLDIDKCSSIDFISEILDILSLPHDYEWVVKSGSHNGFHIHFQCPANDFFPDNGKVKVFFPNSKYESVFQKIEFRFHNHIVLPPSLHCSSQHYSFLNVNFPKNVPSLVSKINLSKLIKNTALFSDIYIESEFYDSSPSVALFGTQPYKIYPDDEFISLSEGEAFYKKIEESDFIELEKVYSMPKCKVLLKRPLIFFDTETTGTDKINDRIIELSTTKFFPDGKKEIITQRFNPTIPIPASATAVHHISDDDVKSKPTFAAKASEIVEYFKDCDFAGYNIIEFDIPILVEELLRAKVLLPFNSDTKFIDALKIFFLNEKRDLTSAYKYYCGKDFSDAHAAEADVLASIEVLNSQIVRYDLDNSASALHLYCNTGKEIIDYDRKFTRNELGDVIFTFGKHKNKIAANEVDYLCWMLTANFSNYTKLIIHRILNGEFPRSIINENHIADNNDNSIF